jgi:hypothetical protein
MNGHTAKMLRKKAKEVAKAPGDVDKLYKASKVVYQSLPKSIRHKVRKEA